MEQDLLIFLPLFDGTFRFHCVSMSIVRVCLHIQRMQIALFCARHTFADPG